MRVCQLHQTFLINEFISNAFPFLTEQDKKHIEAFLKKKLGEAKLSFASDHIYSLLRRIEAGKIRSETEKVDHRKEKLLKELERQKGELEYRLGYLSLADLERFPLDQFLRELNSVVVPVEYGPRHAPRHEKWKKLVEAVQQKTLILRPLNDLGIDQEMLDQIQRESTPFVTLENLGVDREMLDTHFLPGMMGDFRYQVSEIFTHLNEILPALKLVEEQIKAVK